METTYEMFCEELLRTGGYKTDPARAAAKPHKPSRLATVRFGWSTFRVFPKVAVLEARKKLDQNVWAKICFGCIATCEKLGGRVEIDGFDARRDYGKPVVYVANHMSTLETILLPAVLVQFGQLNIVVKASLSHLPFLEKSAAHMGLLPVTRTDPRKDLMTMFNDGVARIKAGGSFLVFPQGTRQSGWNEKKFSSIGAKVAEKAGVPIVPIAVKTDMLPTREKGMFKDFGTVDPAKTVKVAAGPVLEGSAREMHAKSVAWIGGKLKEWGMA
ncbi:MAG: 1-acyl-sn-glycerol-3-phosphate acyltransferase [Kiritimatiellae bacterium]|nr:1-acyl-sn-glycerol-3-phosphate acyltransferase [Kiritimatiellia bacterium]